MILLNEATTDQIIDELFDRSEYMAVLVSIPEREGGFITSFKGNHIEKIGMANLLKMHMEAINLNNYFNFKEE